MKKKLITAGGILLWLIVWQVAAMILGKDVLLVSPVTAVKRLFELASEITFWERVLYSSLRILEGFFIGLVTGTALAVLAGRFVVIEKLFAPLVSCFKSIPVASFTILALIWISSDDLSVLVSFMIAVPIIYSNLLEGIRSLDKKLSVMADVFRIPPVRRFIGINLSQMMPYFRSALRLGMGLSWKSGVAAEVIGIPSGSLGELLYSSKVYLETADLFAVTIAVIILSLICEKVMLLLTDLVTKRIERL